MTYETKRYNPKNPLHVRLARTLSHGVIANVFSDCELVGVHLYFKTQEALDLATKHAAAVKQAHPNLIMELKRFNA